MSEITPEKRNRTIIRTSMTILLVNTVLAGFKAVIGVLTSSIAIMLDAVNNLSDALSSIITFAGTKLADRQPDKKHPLGHGRIEYLSALIVSGTILYAGITSITESVKKIIHPRDPRFTPLSLILLALFIIVKLILSRYVVKTGRRVDSTSLVASGKDAGFDAILSASVLLSIILYMKTGILLEAWVGMLLSVFIIKAGIQLTGDTLDDILGKRTDPELSRKIKESVNKNKEVLGVHDLIINSYGPGRSIGSIHIEIPETMTARQIDTLTRKIAADIYRDYKVALTGISIYARAREDKEAVRIQENVLDIVSGTPGVLDMHAFNVNREQKVITFDIIIDYQKKDREQVYSTVLEAVKKRYPDWEVSIFQDIDA